MNFKPKSLTGILSWMVIASLVVLSTDTAWSEAPRDPQGKKSQAKKSKANAKKSAPKPAVTNKAVPTTAVTNAVPAVKPGVTTSPLPVTPPVQTLATATGVPAGQSEAARPAPAQAQVPANPYMAPQQSNPWAVQVYKGVPAHVNPYLAYRYAAPQAAPTPWNPAPAQLPLFTPPTWVNPFMAVQPMPQPVPTPWSAPSLPAFQANAPAWVNPYLAYRLPQAQVQPLAQATPWTPPSFQVPQFTLPSWPSPVPATAQAPLPIPWAAPAVPVPMPNVVPAWASNPYLAYQRAPAMQPPVEIPAAPVQSAPAPATNKERPADTASTPWTIPSPPVPTQTAEKPASTNSLSSILGSLKYALLPGMPPSDQAILPTVKTVYPTGEKPLKVLTFKCPTELIGVTPLPTKALHELVNVAMDGINRTDLLPFNMQQVCQ